MKHELLKEARCIIELLWHSSEDKYKGKADVQFDDIPEEIIMAYEFEVIHRWRFLFRRKDEYYVSHVDAQNTTNHQVLHNALEAGMDVPDAFGFMEL